MTPDPEATGRLQALQRGATPDEAMGFFDALPPVDVASLRGAWVGSGLPTGHVLDGLLESYGWHGKRFGGPDEAYPLVFADGRGRFSVDPAGLPVGLLPRLAERLHDPRVVASSRRLLRLRRTRRPAARLRMMAYRGVVTATMTYDALPINDHFRRVDDDTLLGVMDLRGVPPFFFVLRREIG